MRGGGGGEEDTSVHLLPGMEWRSKGEEKGAKRRAKKCRGGEREEGTTNNIFYPDPRGGRR